MNRFFDKDFYVKSLSTLIAIILWFYVLNTDNPYGTKTFIVPLRIENLNMLQENNLYLKNSNTLRRSIEVTVRGRDEVIKTISVNDFEAILDFSKVKSVNDKYLAIDGPYYDTKDITPVLVSPQTINIELERIISETFPVQLITTGVPKNDYKLIKAEVAQKTIQLRNRESLINQVGSVRVEVNVTGMNEDSNETVECKVFDKQGNIISDLSKGLSANVKLYFAKEVPVSLVVTGALSADYAEIHRSVAPERVLITGAPDILEKTTEIRTVPVNINNATKSIASNVEFNLPEGVSLVDSSGQATVNITIEQLQQTELVLNKNELLLLNADSEYSYAIQSENVVLKLKGRAADLNRLNKNTIYPTLNVSGLAEGVSTVPLSVTLPSWIKQIGDVTVEVKIEKISEVLE